MLPLHFLNEFALINGPVEVAQCLLAFIVSVWSALCVKTLEGEGLLISSFTSFDVKVALVRRDCLR